MPALPWTTISSPDRAREYVVMASRLPLARYRDMPGFLRAAMRAGSADTVALLDQAVEDLAALAGDPVADAEVAVAADDSLVLGHIYRAYLALYGMTPEGVATAAEIVKKLDTAVLGER